jgi:hypothetical protein
MNFGFTACHDVVPGVQRLALHAADALDELEAAFVPARVRRAAGSGAAAGPAKTTRRKPARKSAKESAKESAAGRPAKANSPRTGGRGARSARPRPSPARAGKDLA